MALTPEERQARSRAFRELHRSGCFVIPNPWDVGSARYLASLGFKALATTSAGAAWSWGRPDGGLSLDQVIDHVRVLADATALPLNVDLESGFSADAAGVALSVTRAIDAGAAAVSIEDASGVRTNPVRKIDEAVERLKVARAAIDRHAPDVLLVGRAENFFQGRPDLADTVERLKRYAAAGADVLYAPGIKTRDEIAAVVAAVAPKPVNLLVGSDSDLTLDDIAALGVRRISVGGALARAAWGGFMQSARSIAEHGRFTFPHAASGAELNKLLG
jgi:2-methylisocitrate lyase-like PEP mutase family enzyme